MSRYAMPRRQQQYRRLRSKSGQAEGEQANARDPIHSERFNRQDKGQDEFDHEAVHGSQCSSTARGRKTEAGGAGKDISTRCFTGLPGWDAYKLQDHTPQDSIALFREKPLDFEPGAKFYYSNSNYIVLGQIIEKVSGMSYADFLQKNIFMPLGMMETGVDSTSFILPQRAQGYDSVPDGFKHAAYVSTTIPYSAGFLYSTVSDLMKWERGLFGGRVLSAASLQTMTTADRESMGWAFSSKMRHIMGSLRTTVQLKVLIPH
jgi:hypothetical protein